jgi:hypothetical protein
MWTQLVLLPWIVCAGALQLPSAGLTEWTEAKTQVKTPWTATVTSKDAGWLLIELEGQDADADLDLVVKTDSWSARSATHLCRELLLLPLLANECLRLEVPTNAKSTFRIGLTPLRPEGWLSPGERSSGRLGGPARARLFWIQRPAPVPIVVNGQAELFVFDDRGEQLSAGTAANGTAPLTNPALGVPRCLALLRAPAAATSGPFSVRVARASVPASALERFLDRLGKTPAQRLVIKALCKSPDFQRMRDYLERYPGGIPLRLLVVPGLKAHGIERFGTYSRGTLAINPTIAAHQTNPQELIDTLVHELVHAILSLPRAANYPLAANVLDSSHDRRLRGLGGAPLKRGVHPEPFATYLESQYGPSASNPQEDYTDINAGAQRLIVKVIRDNLARTGQGKQTLVFRNTAHRDAQLAETK